VAALVWIDLTVSIATIVVNFNAGEMLRDCVAALIKSTVRTRVTIIDNASSDGSAQNLQHLYGNHQGIEFLFNPTNAGFSPAVNAVARQLDSDWVLILNPDCMVKPDTLAQLKAALEDDDGAALAAPVIGRGYKAPVLFVHT